MPGPLRTTYRALHRAFFDALAAAGWNVARSRDYYSPLPVRTELVRNRPRWDRPSELVGLSYDLDAMRERLARLAHERAGEWAGILPYEEAKRAGYGPGFTRVDAFLLYAMLRDLKPRRLIEVGSGLSTWYASQAAARNAAEGSPCEIVCLDPYSGHRVEGLPGVAVERRPVQDVEPDFFARLGAGDALFIDSTHVVKVDGDVPHLYLEVVPRLAAGVWVHAHDVHFPYHTPYPAAAYVLDAKWTMAWTEAMLVQAFLAFNREFELALAPPLLRHLDEPFLARTLPGYRPVEAADFDTHFGSVWLRRLAAERP